MRGSSNAQKAETDLTSVNSAITSLQNGKQNKLTFDTVPVSGSSNPITSGAVYDAFDNAGYVSNQIVPLGYFTGTAAFTKSTASGDTAAGLKYYLSKTYNSTTTTKNSSPYMEYYVLEALCKIGEYEVAYNRIKDRYEDMVNKDYSTLWEFWNSSPPDWA